MYSQAERKADVSEHIVQGRKKTVFMIELLLNGLRDE